MSLQRAGRTMQHRRRVRFRWVWVNLPQSFILYCPNIVKYSAFLKNFSIAASGPSSITGLVDSLLEIVRSPLCFFPFFTSILHFFLFFIFFVHPVSWTTTLSNTNIPFVVVVIGTPNASLHIGLVNRGLLLVSHKYSASSPTCGSLAGSGVMMICRPPRRSTGRQKVTKKWSKNDKVKKNQT